MMDFSDKVVVITGAGSGIGEATARKFDELGGKVVVTDIDPEKGSNVSDSLKGSQFFALDVTRYDEVKQVMEKIHGQYEAIDVLVNNAGIGPAQLNKTADHTLEDWDNVIAVNQSGVFYGMKEALKYMDEQQSGSIVNVSSLAGLKASGNVLSYSASKFAVVGMTKSAALEYASKNIRINAVCPSYTESALLDQLLNMKDNMEPILKSYIPMKRFGKPEEIAEAIVWLASDQTKFITGQALVLDGGTSL